MAFHESPHFDYRPRSRRLPRLRRAGRKLVHRLLGLQPWQHELAHHLDQLTPAPAQVFHLHNLHGAYFDLGALPRLAKTAPVFVTLHDHWLFTGHCVTPLECERWRQGCGRCPDLRRQEAIARDATRFNLRRRVALLGEARVRLAAPSEYLRRKALASALGGVDRDLTVIPNGVDTRVFSPGDSIEARRLLGLSAADLVAITHCAGGADHPARDLGACRDALLAAANDVGKPLVWIVVGGADGRETSGALQIRTLAPQNDGARLVSLLRAADVYLMAPREETFGLAIAEGMACGLPVVTPRVGAVPELVENGAHGWLAPLGDTRGLAAALSSLLTKPDQRAGMGRAAAARIVSDYSLETMADRTLRWYAERRS